MAGELIKAVGELNEAARRRLDGRPFTPTGDDLFPGDTRDILINSPDGRRLYRVAEDRDEDEDITRVIEEVLHQDDPSQTTLDQNLLPPDTDPDRIGLLDRKPLGEIRRMTQDIQDGNEDSSQEGRRRYERALRNWSN